MPSPRKKDAPECGTRPGSAHCIYFGISGGQIESPQQRWVRTQPHFSQKQCCTHLVSGHQGDVSVLANRVSLDKPNLGRTSQVVQPVDLAYNMPSVFCSD